LFLLVTADPIVAEFITLALSEGRIPVELQKAKTHKLADMEVILEILMQGRPGTSLPTEAQALENINRANRKVEEGIRRAAVPAVELLKVDRVFDLLPRSSFERLILSLIVRCFGWAGRIESPWRESPSVGSTSQMTSFEAPSVPTSVQGAVPLMQRDNQV
jgi:hypothetical protein